MTRYVSVMQMEKEVNEAYQRICELQMQRVISTARIKLLRGISLVKEDAE